MSNSNSLQEVVSGEDEETESEEDFTENAEDFELIDKENIAQSMQKLDTDKVNVIVSASDTKTSVEDKNNNQKNQQKQKQNTKDKINRRNTYESRVSRPQFKEITSARSKFDIMKFGFGKIIKSGKKMVAKNFRAKKRSVWENAIYEATTVFHEKIFKSASCNLNPIKKQSEKAKSQCQQSVVELHHARAQIDKANKKIQSFCDTGSDKYKLGWTFEL